MPLALEVKEVIDYAEERRLIEQEMQYLQDKYDIYGEDDEVPV